MNALLAVLAVSVLGAAGSQPPPAPTGSAESAIRLADEAWANAVGSKSIEQTVAMYDVEAVTAGSAMFPARGVAALRAEWAKLFAQPDFSLRWKAESVVVTASATVGYSTGQWWMGDATRGPYLAVWRKQPDGNWKVIVDAAWFARAVK